MNIFYCLNHKGWEQKLKSLFRNEQKIEFHFYAATYENIYCMITRNSAAQAFLLFIDDPHQLDVVSSYLHSFYPTAPIVLLSENNTNRVLFQEEVESLYTLQLSNDINSIVPLTFERFVLEYSRTTLILPYRHYKICYSFDEIIYIESKKHNVIIHTKTQSDIIQMRLSDLESLLSQAFVRCHQSYIVNMNYVVAIRETYFTLRETSIVIPISRKYRKQALERFQLYLITKGSNHQN